MADVNLYLEEPKKVIGEYTDFFAGQLPTASDFNRWLAVLIAQGDYNTAWLDLVAQKAGISINELYEELSILSEIVTPGSGTLFSQRLSTLETNTGGWRTYADLAAISGTLTSASTLNQIIPLMAEKSKLTLKNGQADYTGLGYALDVAYVEITKLGLDRVIIKAYRNFSGVTNTTAAEYYAVWDYATNTVKGFFKLIDNNDLYTWVDITSQVSKGVFVEVCRVLYNPTTKEVRATIFCNSTLIPASAVVLSMPLEYRPGINISVFNGGVAKKDVSLGVSDWNPASIGVYANGDVIATFYTGVDMCYLQGTFSYIAI